MVGTAKHSDWNSFARTNASERWRRQSATMGTPLTQLIVAEAKVEPGMAVLDVACGTGEPAISIAMRLNGAGGGVIGVEISPEPLKVAGGGRMGTDGAAVFRYDDRRGS
jgi:ubiquinone/menaquinone biosynthesis C-methylase UbiE